MSKTTFIYALCEPASRVVRYIGKSDFPQRRFSNHLSRSARRQSHLGCWLRSILSRGELPSIVILREVPVETWQAEEALYIKAARVLGLNLVNATDGGEGCSGRSPSAETRSKMRAAKLGKKLSAAHCANMSIALKGRTTSPTSLAKLLVSNRGRRHSLVSRQNMSAAKLRRHQVQTVSI